MKVTVTFKMQKTKKSSKINFQIKGTGVRVDKTTKIGLLRYVKKVVKLMITE